LLAIALCCRFMFLIGQAVTLAMRDLVDVYLHFRMRFLDALENDLVVFNVLMIGDATHSLPSETSRDSRSESAMNNNSE